MADRAVFVAAGKRGARKRWGEPRVVRLDELTPDQRRAILSYLEVAKSATDSDSNRAA